MSELDRRVGKAARLARVGLLVNAVLALIKLLAGILGHSYALIADAVESSADVFSSLIVWGGLRVSSRAPDESYPYGYGKAEPISAAVVSLMLIGAAIGISIQAVREIGTSHQEPAGYTIVVLLLVVVIKEVLFQRVFRYGASVGSTLLKADAWHHRSDAITSAVAAVGIGVAIYGGPDWAQADDWAALVAAGVILVNGCRILRPAMAELMDRTPEPSILKTIRRAALELPEVQEVETLRVRRSGLELFVLIHVESDADMSLREAHFVSGKVKAAIREAMPEVKSVTVHMEPFEGAPE